MAVGAVVGGIVGLNLWLAYRARPVFVPVSGPDDPVARYRTDELTAAERWAVVAEASSGSPRRRAQRSGACSVGGVPVR